MSKVDCERCCSIRLAFNQLFLIGNNYITRCDSTPLFQVKAAQERAPWPGAIDEKQDHRRTALKWMATVAEAFLAGIQGEELAEALRF